MHKGVAAAVVVGCWAVPVLLCQAEEKPASLPDVAAPAPACAAPCPPPVEKTISRREVYLVEEQAACTLPALTPREVELARTKEASLEVAWHEAPFVCTELTLKPREVDQEVVCTTVAPVTKVDLATGQACTVYEQVPVVKKVRVTVYDVVPEERAYLVRTPYLKPVEKCVIVKGLTVDATTEPAVEKRLRVITVPCEAKVVMPACPVP